MMPGSWGEKLEECCEEQGRLAEASEEGLGSNRAVAPMMMMMSAFLLPRKFFTTRTNEDQAHDSISFIDAMKYGSFISCLICGPSKIPAFSFSMVSPGNLCAMYSMHEPSLFKAFTNCFIRPSFICSGGRMILSRATKGSLITFCPPTTIYSLGGPIFSCPVFIFVSTIPKV